MKIKKMFLSLVLSAFLAISLPVLASCGADKGANTRAQLINKAKYAVTQIRVDGAEARAGSGVIVYKDKHKIRVITNHHVIEDATSVQVKPFSSQSFYSATVLGHEKYFDIAVLEVELTAEILSACHALSAAPATNLGDDALAIGYSNTQLSVFDGMVSTSEKLIYHSLRQHYLYVIQTTTAFLQGCSGGALINNSGELLGIISYAPLAFLPTETINTGLGYSIPIQIALALYQRIINGDSVPYSPALGFFVNDDFSITLYLSGNEFDIMFKDGLLTVTSVKNAPFNEGDIITKVNDYAVNKSMVKVIAEVIKSYDKVKFFAKSP